MSKMKDLHIDIQVETAKLVEKLNVISKHAKALAADLEELDKEDNEERVGQREAILFTGNDNPLDGIIYRKKM